MRFPKLNRKQKIARNFLLIALALLLFEWLLHFRACSAGRSGITCWRILRFCSLGVKRG